MIQRIKDSYKLALNLASEAGMRDLHEKQIHNLNETLTNFKLNLSAKKPHAILDKATQRLEISLGEMTPKESDLGTERLSPILTPGVDRSG
jgi:hypothetical protein